MCTGILTCRVPSRWLPAAIVAASLLMGAGCTGAAAAKSGPSHPTETQVIAREWEFQVTTLHLVAGQPYALVFKNSGTVFHDITIPEFGVKALAMPGETVRVTFTPAKAGEFEGFCAQPGHKEAGQRMTVAVAPAAGGRK